MNDRLNLSVDLKRVCSWILQGSDDLVSKTLERDIKMYGGLDFKIGKVEIGEWLWLIKKSVGGRERSAERALTASVILASQVGV
ncbi:MAG: hypothetical protein U9Q63_03975 [Patescibacteria group bacterium]|nr:hypothetical protein [Patescibacteria group bacterium]